MTSTFLDAKGAFAADVEITANTSSVDLDTFTGTTARINSGVTIGPSSPAISATLQAWSLTNNGAVSGGNAVRLNQGGTFLNASGATVTGSLTAMTFGYKPIGLPPAGGPGYLDNYGTIIGGVEGVTMWFGGTVNNYVGGTIKTETGLNAVSIGQGTSRTLFNSGSIQATKTTGFSTGVLIQGGPSAFTNASTGVIFGDYNGVYASASAVFTSFGNAGSISSRRGPAVEATGGGTIVNTGVIGSTNAEGILIRNNSNADITNSGSISGAVNAISFAAGGGAATAAVHTLRLQTGSALNGNVLGGANTDNLILEGAGAESIAKFQNFEGLTMNGADWTLNGAGAFSTGTTVQAGVLRVNGQLTSPAVDVQSGGALTGSGAVVGNVTNNTGGNVRVDSGTLTFNGNYIHQMGAFFTVGVTPSTNGVLAITGAGHTATINGGTVRVLAGAGNYAPNATYTILTTTGGRTGAFDNVTSNLAFLTPSLAYDPNNVYLTLVRNSVDFAGIGGTPNQMSAGRGVEALGVNNPIVGAALLLTPGEARAAFDSLSGEIHPSLRAVMLDESRLLRDAIVGRMRQDGASGSSKAVAGAPAYETWTQAFGNWTRLGGNGNAATARSATGGAVGGVDVTLDHDWRFGVAAGGGGSDIGVAARSSSGAIDTFHVAAYGAGTFGAIGLRAGAAYSRHDVRTNRIVAFRGFADAPHAGYGAGTAQFFGEAAYRLELDRTRAEVFADAAHVGVGNDGFTESGGAAALSVASSTEWATFTTLGTRLRSTIWSTEEWGAAVRGSLGWQHGFNVAGAVSSMAFATRSFASSAAPFPIAGASVASDALLIEAGLEGLLAGDMRLSLGYSSRLAAEAGAHAVKGDFILRF